MHSPRALFAVLAAALAVLPSTGRAAEVRYICEGRVQDRPCSVSERPVRKLGVTQQGVAVVVGSDGRPVLIMKETRVTKLPRAVVKDVTFKPLGRDQGYWRGYVEGHGKISLFLNISRNGRPESQRAMGHVLFERGQRSVPFNFRAPLPSGSNWTWQVSAHAQ